MAVVRVAVNWCAHTFHVFDWQNVHLSVVQDGRNGHGRDGPNRHQLAMVDMRMMFEGGMCIDLVETEQLSETVGDVYRGFAHGMARATASLSGGDDLDAVQAILAAYGRSGGVVEEFAGRTDLIRG